MNGALESFNLEQETAERLILRARVAAGWIEDDGSDVEEEVEQETSYVDEVFGGEGHETAPEGEPVQTPAEEA